MFNDFELKIKFFMKFPGNVFEIQLVVTEYENCLQIYYCGLKANFKIEKNVKFKIYIYTVVNNYITRPFS